MALDPVDTLSHIQRGNPIQGFNRYVYANNNPYKYVDPDGEFLNFVFKFVADVAINATLNYLETGSVDLGSAVSDAAVAAVNPAKTLLKAKRIAQIVNKSDKVAGSGLKRAEALRDAELKKVSQLSKTQRSKITTVVGAHDPATGRVAVGVKKTCAANAGKCAEDLASEALGNPKNIEFTKVIRPRNEKVIPRCDRCTGKYGPEK